MNEEFVKSFLSQDAFFSLNKELVREIGIIETAVFALLLDRYDVFMKNNKLDNGEFYCNSEYIQNSLNIGRKPLEKAIANLESIGFIKTCRKGIPAKKYFLINFDFVYSFVTNRAKTVCTK